MQDSSVGSLSISKVNGHVAVSSTKELDASATVDEVTLDDTRSDSTSYNKQ